jgi:hypothetical protein
MHAQLRLRLDRVESESIPVASAADSSPLTRSVGQGWCLFL